MRCWISSSKFDVSKISLYLRILISSSTRSSCARHALSTFFNITQKVIFGFPAKAVGLFRRAELPIFGSDPLFELRCKHIQVHRFARLSRLPGHPPDGNNLFLDRGQVFYTVQHPGQTLPLGRRFLADFILQKGRHVRSAVRCVRASGIRTSDSASRNPARQSCSCGTWGKAGVQSWVLVLTARIPPRKTFGSPF
jgi:hypothetical protein